MKEIDELIKKWSHMGTQKIDASVFRNDLETLKEQLKEQHKEDVDLKDLVKTKQ